MCLRHWYVIIFQFSEYSEPSDTEPAVLPKTPVVKRRLATPRSTASPLPGRLGPPPKKMDGKLPPLLAKVNGHEEVTFHIYFL